MRWSQGREVAGHGTHLRDDQWCGRGDNVIGEGFAEVLAAAQEGSEAAFSRLWRDGNPALLRYVRVVASEAAEDVAADTWLQVVRGLTGFRGDEPGVAGLAVHHRPPPRHRPRQAPGAAAGWSRWMRCRPGCCRPRRMSLTWRSSG